MLFAVLFVLLAVGCTVLAFVRHPIYALYFYFASIYVFPYGRWWGYVFGETRWALISAAVTVLAIAFHRGKLKPKPIWLLSVPAIVMVIYASWMWVQTAWALDIKDHLDGTGRFTKYVLSFWFVYRLADSKEHVRDVLFAHLAGCALLGVLCYVQGRTGDRLDGVGGPGMDDANTLGMYLATGAVVGLGLIITQHGWLRVAAFIGCVITLEGLVLTNTRGAFLALVGGWLAMAIFKSKVHRRMFWALAAVGLMGLAVVVDQTFVDRMWTIRESTVDSEEVDASARSRIIVARAQWEMFLDYPMGSGHRGTAALSARYLEDRWLTGGGDSGQGARSSHNTFLTTLAEQGIPGAILFVWLAFWTVLALVRRRLRDAASQSAEATTLAATVGGVLAVVFVAGNTADFLMAEVQFWMFALLITLLRFSDSSVRDPSSALKDTMRPGLSTLSRGHG